MRINTTGKRGYMETKRFGYEELDKADLFIDAIYMSPRPATKSIEDDVLSKFLRLPNLGGFRVAKKANKTDIAFVVLYLNKYTPAWPDDFDTETGILTYYGDNIDAGNEIEKTKRRGNLILRQIFDNLAEGGEALNKIPPILLFQKTGEERDVRFLGLAVPGVPNLHPDEYFSTVWRTQNGIRFPNYVAKFSVIKLEEGFVKKEWLNALRQTNDKALDLAPSSWKNFTQKGLNGIEPLSAPQVIEYPGKSAMLPADEDGKSIIKAIHKKYGKNDSVGFEKFAKKLMYLMDSNFQNINLTRPWKDGGRDAIAEYVIKAPSNKLVVECAMEAKCYDPGKEGVAVKQTSRLISRIKHRQFGILITTSYIAKQAYDEVKEDGHPILFCTGKDIATILQQKANVTSKTINEWLEQNVEK